MESVEFERPGTVEEAVALLQGASGNAKILAGGTDPISPIEGPHGGTRCYY